ncbi:MAG: phospholipase D-like domain-containing protein [Haloarculaceae archaeon]
MGRRLLVVLVLVVLCWHIATIVAVAEGNTTRCDTQAAASGTGRDTRILTVHPNPVADGDAGEFVTLRVPPGDSAVNGVVNLSLSDGEATAEVPEVPGAEVTLSNAPDRVTDTVSGPVSQLPAGFALANGGDTVLLRAANRTVDCVQYSDAPEGDVLAVPAGDRSPSWKTLGTTDFDVATAGSGLVRAFLLPDAPGVPVDTLRAADRRLFLAAYTLTSRRVAEALRAARDRGVDVRVVVDRDPVGGMSARQASLLDNLTAAGVDVTTLGGEDARYDYHHAKYAVADERALVTTENWKPAGTGGRSSRGWGVVTSQPAVVRRLAALFRADAGWRGAEPWRAVREEVETEPPDPASDRFPRERDPERLRVNGSRLLIAPENAEGAVVAAIDAANESVDVLQVSVGGPHQPFVRAIRRAARRGVEVRLLLSSAWYVEGDNRDIVTALRTAGANRSLPLEVRLAEPRGRFEKVHAKGVVVDGETVILGSLNWNNHSARENREVALRLDGEAAAAYYLESFEADWRGTATRIPVGLLVGLAVVATMALLWSRRIEFGRPDGPDPRPDRSGPNPGPDRPRRPNPDPERPRRPNPDPERPAGRNPTADQPLGPDQPGRHQGALRPSRARPRRSQAPRRSRPRPSSRRERR